MKDRDQVRSALVGASIASMTHHHINRGLGEPTVEDMARFVAVSEGIAELFDDAEDVREAEAHRVIEVPRG